MSVAAGSRREQAAREARSCDELAEAHQIAYSFWVLLDRVMAIAGLIAASVVAVKLFGQAEKGTSEWKIAAYLSVIAAVCSGFNVFLSAGSRTRRPKRPSALDARPLAGRQASPQVLVLDPIRRSKPSSPAPVMASMTSVSASLFPGGVPRIHSQASLGR